jgi:HAD superfamily hydrolase (TIGR01450 family)
MTTETALTQYEAARHRLPAASGAGACAARRDLSELAESYDIFLLDAFGVLNIGEEPIPGVPERIAALQAAGKRVLVLTNAASFPRAALVRKYARLGYRFDYDDVISSRDVLKAALRDEPARRWGVMAVAAQQDGDLDHLNPVFLGDRPEDHEAAEGFLLLGSAEWSEHRQTLLEATLTGRPRPVWVGNPDVVAPRLHGFSVEPGHYAHRLADSTGIVPRFFGKPFGNIFDTAFARLGAGADRTRAIMVGDSLHTDVLGARAMGIASALVAGYGFFAGRQASEAVRRTGIAPDYILERP